MKKFILSVFTLLNIIAGTRQVAIAAQNENNLVTVCISENVIQAELQMDTNENIDNQSIETSKVK